MINDLWAINGRRKRRPYAQRLPAKRSNKGSAAGGYRHVPFRTARSVLPGIIPSLTVALNCGMESSSLKAEVIAFTRLKIVRRRKSSYLGSKYQDVNNAGESSVPPICHQQTLRR